MDKEKIYKQVDIDFKIIYNALSFYVDSMNENEFNNMEEDKIKEMYSTYEQFNERLKYIKNTFAK